MKPRRPLSGCPRRRDARAPPRAPGAARPLAAGRAARGGPAFNFPRGSRARPRRIPGGHGVGTALSPPARGQRGGRGWRPLPPTRAHPPLPPALLSEGGGGRDGNRSASLSLLPPELQVGLRPFPAVREAGSSCGFSFSAAPSEGRSGNPVYTCIRVHMYMCIYVYVYICVNVYIRTQVAAGKLRAGGRGWRRGARRLSCPGRSRVRVSRFAGSGTALWPRRPLRKPCGTSVQKNSGRQDPACCWES